MAGRRQPLVNRHVDALIILCENLGAATVNERTDLRAVACLRARARFERRVVLERGQTVTRTRRVDAVEQAGDGADWGSCGLNSRARRRPQWTGSGRTFFNLDGSDFSFTRLSDGLARCHRSARLANLCDGLARLNGFSDGLAGLHRLARRACIARRNRRIIDAARAWTLSEGRSRAERDRGDKGKFHLQYLCRCGNC